MHYLSLNVVHVIIVTTPFDFQLRLTKDHDRRPSTFLCTVSFAVKGKNISVLTILAQIVCVSF